MKKTYTKIKVVILLVCCILALGPFQIVKAIHGEEISNALDEDAVDAMGDILEKHQVLALVYLDRTQTLWEEPSDSGEKVIELPTGQTVFVKSVFLDVQCELWIEVEAYVAGKTYSGFIPRRYLACSDEEFLAWENEYVKKTELMLFSATSDEEAEQEQTTQERIVYEDIEQFPESYKEALYALKTKFPNWIFVRMDTALQWNVVVDNELKNDRSLIYYSSPEHVRGEAYDDGKWYYPTRKVLEYYLDPRNGLTESGIFQFELLTYNKTYHTQNAVRSFLDKTFMHGNQLAPGTNMTYDKIFWAIGAELNVSPFHLTSRVYQEQGQGKSALISGNYPGYEGYYNYFNVRATGTSTKEIIENGLAYAKQQNWNSAYYSILGGSKLLSSGYITKGQDTVYLQKYNVNPNGYYPLFTHQYMQNIGAPSSEASTIRNMYHNVGALDNTFVFKIPVYGGMPEGVCPYPSAAKEGWYEEEGGWYWYENDVKQGTQGRGKEIYDPDSDAWYWLDAVDGGKKAVNKDVYLEKSDVLPEQGQTNSGKWVRYDENGRMVKGEDNRYGGWYRFDEVTGAMIKGWYTTGDERTYYYDRSTGQMVHGYVKIEGKTYYFDKHTGVMADCIWVKDGDNDYWYEKGIRQGLEGRGKEIYDPKTDAWYWLDAIADGRKAVSKDVYQESVSAFPDKEDGTGKWVRYDENGHMIKGWHTTEKGTYYFEQITGAMAKGEVVIGGVTYYFDLQTGIRQ